jgi:hypothetical protein
MANTLIGGGIIVAIISSLVTLTLFKEVAHEEGMLDSKIKRAYSLDDGECRYILGWRSTSQCNAFRSSADAPRNPVDAFSECGKSDGGGKRGKRPAFGPQSI